jgi:hypothetical protein
MGDGVGVCLLRLADRNDLERVCDFFRGVDVRVRDEGNGTVGVSVAAAPTPLHEQREIAGYVTTWNALNPASPVELITRTGQSRPTSGSSDPNPEGRPLRCRT